MMLATIVMLSALGTVELRGGGVVDAPVEDISISGVRVGGSAPRTISWDRVRRVDGEFADEAAPFAELSENAWRARTRLDRGDTYGALALLGELESACAGKPGATPEMVFATAFEVHLREGDQPAALRAYFELRRLIEDPRDWPRYALDPSTGLPPGLSPFLTPHHASGAKPVLSPNQNDPEGLARLRASFDAAVRADPSALPPGGGKNAAELLLGRIARAAAGEEQALRELRLWQRDLEDEPGTEWRAAWVHAAAARGKLRSSDPSTVRRGVVEYLHIPTLLAGDAAYLSGLAYSECAQALDRLGETASARTLRSELSRLSPAHPALSRQPANGAPSP